MDGQVIVKIHFVIEFQVAVLSRAVVFGVVVNSNVRFEL